jgi:hypothetical protein
LLNLSFCFIFVSCCIAPPSSLFKLALWGGFGSTAGHAHTLGVALARTPPTVQQSWCQHFVVWNTT